MMWGIPGVRAKNISLGIVGILGTQLLKFRDHSEQAYFLDGPETTSNACLGRCDNLLESADVWGEVTVLLFLIIAPFRSSSV